MLARALLHVSHKHVSLVNASAKAAAFVYNSCFGALHTTVGEKAFTCVTILLLLLTFPFQQHAQKTHFCECIHLGISLAMGLSSVLFSFPLGVNVRVNMWVKKKNLALCLAK